MKINDILIGNIILYDDEVIHTLFTEDSEYYYDILDDNREYYKDASYEFEQCVEIKDRLDNYLPNINKNYDLNLNDVLLLLPKKIYDYITFNPLREDVKVKRMIYSISEYNDDWK